MRDLPSTPELTSSGDVPRRSETALEQLPPASPRPAATSARLPHRWERGAHTMVGLAFGAAAAGNLIGFLPRAAELLPWFADTAWFPPYEWLLHQVLPVAPVVVFAGAVVEATIAALLLTRRQVPLGLGLATGWLLGLIPAVGWPYWTPNLLAGVVLALLWRRSLRHER